ncbi:MAG: hypothetical protein GXO42_00805 [bacterium]|nr:hypothetical protein [bacterium]
MLRLDAELRQLARAILRLAEAAEPEIGERLNEIVLRLQECSYYITRSTQAAAFLARALRQARKARQLVYLAATKNPTLAEKAAKITAQIDKVEELLKEALIPGKLFLKHALLGYAQLLYCVGLFQYVLLENSVISEALARARSVASEETARLLDIFKEKFASMVMHDIGRLADLQNSSSSVARLKDNLLEAAESVQLPEVYYWIIKLLPENELEIIVRRRIKISKKVAQNINLLLLYLKLYARLLLGYIIVLRKLLEEEKLQQMFREIILELGEFGEIVESLAREALSNEKLLPAALQAAKSLLEDLLGESAEKQLSAHSYRGKLRLLALSLLCTACSARNLVACTAKELLSRLGNRLPADAVKDLQKLADCTAAEILGRQPKELLALSFPELTKFCKLLEELERSGVQLTV